jgi:hypothetical protein
MNTQRLGFSRVAFLTLQYVQDYYANLPARSRGIRSIFQNPPDRLSLEHVRHYQPTCSLRKRRPSASRSNCPRYGSSF